MRIEITYFADDDTEFDTEEECRAYEARQLLKHKGVYLAAIGGAGAMLSRCIRSAEVIAFDDLGTEAIRKLHVVDFPAVVIYDCHGNDYYEMARRAYLDSL